MVERRASWRDFNCPHNWVLEGTNINPEQGFPCSRDTAVFPYEGRASFSVVVPPNSFVDAVKGNTMDDRTQFSRAATDINGGTQCPKPFSSDKSAMYCSAWCVNSCLREGVSNATANMRVLDASRDELGFVQAALLEGQGRLNESTRIVSALGTVAFTSMLKEKSAAVVSAVASAFGALKPFAWEVCTLLS